VPRIPEPAPALAAPARAGAISSPHPAPLAPLRPDDGRSSRRF